MSNKKQFIVANPLLCRRLFAEHKELAEEFSKDRNAECTNDILWNGFRANEYTADELYKKKVNGKIFCFSRSMQLPLLDKLNPFTGKNELARTAKRVHSNALKNMPLSKIVSRTCMDMSLPSHDSILYVISPQPIGKPNEHGIISLDDFGETFQLSDYQVRDAISSGEVCYISSRYLYVMRLKRKKPKSFSTSIPIDEIENIQLISSIAPLSRGERKFQVTQTKTKTQLSEFLKNRRREFTPSVLESFDQLNIKPSKPIKVFRGILLKDRSQVIKMGLENVKIGDSIQLSGRKVPSSWSTDPCVAKYFATHPVCHTTPPLSTTIKYGFIFSTRLDPTQIVVDTRLLSTEFFHSIYFQYQSEIIAKPLEVFECKIEEIYVCKSNKECYGIKDTKMVVETLMN